MAERTESVYWVSSTGRAKEEITTYRTRRNGDEYVASIVNQVREDGTVITKAEYDKLRADEQQASEDARDALRDAEAKAEQLREELAAEAAARADKVFDALVDVGLDDETARYIADAVERS